MGNILSTSKLENTRPSCDMCGNLPSEEIYVAKIYHKGKYHGKHLCKTCLFKKHYKR